MNTRRRALVALLATGCLGNPAEGARAKRIVLFYGETASSAPAIQRAIVSALAAEGLVAGRDVEVEMVAVADWGERHRLADAIVGRRPDLVSTRGTDLTRLMQERTRELPIVFRNVGDPVTAGFVKSLARPGGNITGESNQSFVLEGKRLELLRELRPGLRRVAFVGTAGPAMELARREQHRQAEALGLRIDELLVGDDRGSEEFAAIPARLEALKAEAVVFTAFNAEHPQSQVILDFLAARAMPAVYLDRRMVERGGLASLTMREDYAPAAAIIGRILRGESPATIPVALAARTHLALNLRTARAMKLAIPRSLRLRVDELVE